jgi:hypothetical protein
LDRANGGKAYEARRSVVFGRGLTAIFSGRRAKNRRRARFLFEFMLVNATKSSLWRLFVEKEDS